MRHEPRETVCGVNLLVDEPPPAGLWLVRMGNPFCTLVVGVGAGAGGRSVAVGSGAGEYVCELRGTGTSGGGSDATGAVLGVIGAGAAMGSESIAASTIMDGATGACGAEFGAGSPGRTGASATGGLAVSL